ncbi:hypothetical protein ABBQ38_000767 [Trebouxia sp. C0009 RCD-2024]
MDLMGVHFNRRQIFIGGLLASAALTFVVAFSKVLATFEIRFGSPRLTRPIMLQLCGDTSPIPAFFDKTSRPALSVPPTVLKTCNWGDTTRHNLVIATVGDTSEHTKWLKGSETANWDLAVIYYGNKGTAFTCEQCLHIELGYGAKWTLIYQFTQSGAFADYYVHRYSQVYIPDDDIVQDSSAINRAFDVQELYKLDLAQPTLCSKVESNSVHGTGMYMEAPSVLRYATFVEIMVPLFSMNFFKGNITHTLSTASSGHGLDWIWPYLLGYPQDRIAIIDEICVIHPHQSLQRQGKTSMYDVNPSLSWQMKEEQQQFKKFGYAAKPLRKRFGIAYLEKARLGQVWQPWYADLLKQGGLTERHVADARGSGPTKGVVLVQSPFTLTAWQWPDVPSSPGQAQATRKFLAVPIDDSEHTVFTALHRGNDVFFLIRWLAESVKQPWSVIVIAPQDMEQVTCPHCLFVHRFNPGLEQGRYALLYQLMQSAQWDLLVAGKHKYLYFPEEAVVQDISAISTLLQISVEANLDLAHLTWCSTLDSDSEYMKYMQMSPSLILRFGTYVETAAPLFSWPFLHRIVLPTLVEAQTGKLSLPHGVHKVTAVCPAQESPTKRQKTKEQQQPASLASKKLLAEEQALLDKFNYNPVALGQPTKSQQVFSFIEQPWYHKLMASGALQTMMVNQWEATAARTERHPAIDLVLDESRLVFTKDTAQQ